jgi:hypothetical protein
MSKSSVNQDSPNIQMQTDVLKSHALCKKKSTMRAFSARR